MRRLGVDEREMRVVPLCGAQVVKRLRSIGITRLAQLKDKDPKVLMNQINLAAGKAIWSSRTALSALSNLIAASRAGAAKTKINKDHTEASTRG